MTNRRYHHYIIFDLKPEFFEQANIVRAKLSEEFVAWTGGLEDLDISTYNSQGYKAGSAVVFWCRSDNPEAVQKMLQSLRHTHFGRMLEVTHTMFGVVRRSQYSRDNKLVEQSMADKERLPYLIVYPFTKTHAWHQLDFDARKALMKEHILIGIQHKTIRQTLLHSYGLDDHEFIVSYECSVLEEFQDVVMQLRSTKARPYTENDLPVCVCVYKPVEELIGSL